MIKIEAHQITLFIYNITLVPILFFSVLFIILTTINLFVDRKPKKKFKTPNKLPLISVQIPTFNDPVAERCVKQCLNFDYPKDKYEIIIADDSTNPKTRDILSKYAKKYPEIVKYQYRDNRIGFKAGALKQAMGITKGEIIVIFDSDWIPNKNFLNEIVKPFSDSKVAIVQTKQGFYNKNTNLITRFAAYLLMIYHTIIMPINNRVNCVFFCGTAGAIRRSMFEEVGGWNLNSLTEDSDLTVRLMLKGYKTFYLDHETPSEVPATFESFIKQQMRWCYGNIRVFLDNSFRILFKKGLSIKQRLMITYITIGNFIAPIVVLMTLFGLVSWFIGDPTLFTMNDLIDFFSRLFLTAGFLVLGIATLWKKQRIIEFPYLLLSVFTLGIVLAIANTIAAFKAIINSKLHWYCTTKDDNIKFV